MKKLLLLFVLTQLLAKAGDGSKELPTGHNISSADPVITIRNVSVAESAGVAHVTVHYFQLHWIGKQDATTITISDELGRQVEQKTGLPSSGSM